MGGGGWGGLLTFYLVVQNDFAIGVMSNLTVNEPRHLGLPQGVSRVVRRYYGQTSPLGMTPALPNTIGSYMHV